MSKKYIKIILFLFIVLIGVGCKQQSPANDKESQASLFPKGSKAPAENFTGTVWLHPVVANDSTFHCTMGSVTFEPGARSNWHTHPAGQILLITTGECYTQEKGKPIQVYHKGDVIKCLPNIAHWHGASPDSSMTHIALNVNTQNGVVNWLQPVTDAEYNSLRK